MHRLRSPIWRSGGKGQFVSKMLPYLPPHDIYVEPFCGGASLLLAKPPSQLEVINDIDKTLITFFRMLREPMMFTQFYELLKLTPYSRAEYYDALATWRDTEDILEKLRKWFVINRQSFGGGYGAGWSFQHTAERVRKRARGVGSWLSIIELLPDITKRLLQVQVDCIDFRLCIKRYDGNSTFFYLDPPYIPETRITRDVYKYEMTANDHTDLVILLSQIKGKAMLSGFRHPIYEPLEKAGWQRIDFKHYARRGHSTKKDTLPVRIESLWMNYETD